ncbi:ArsR family transcriptional regulator [Bacillus cereus]
MTTTVHMEIGEYERVTEILRGLANPIRLQIVQYLLMKKALNVSELQQYLAMPQSNLRFHSILVS